MNFDKYKRYVWIKKFVLVNQRNQRVQVIQSAGWVQCS